ncbi:Thioredoxin domain-containing protein 5, partial [Cladochytrium tenue]
APAALPPGPRAEQLRQDSQRASRDIDFLHAASFRTDIARGDWFVFFGESWLTPKWLDLQVRRKAELLRKGMHLGKVECTEAEELCYEEEGIVGFPTLRIFHRGARVSTFEGDKNNITAIEAFLDASLLNLQNATFLKEFALKHHPPQTPINQVQGTQSSSMPPPSALDVAMEAARNASSSVPPRSPRLTPHNKDGKITHLGRANFDELVGLGGGWLVMFHSPRCPHCVRFAPTWEALAARVAGRYNVAKVDCLAEPGLCTRYDIAEYPTIKYL